MVHVGVHDSCLKRSLQNPSTGHLADDFHKCLKLLGTALDEAGVDNLVFKSARDVRAFVESLTECSLGISVDASVLDELIERASSAPDASGCHDSTFAYCLIFAGCLENVVGAALSKKVKSWVQRYVGLSVPQVEVTQEMLMQDHIRLISDARQRKRWRSDVDWGDLAPLQRKASRSDSVSLEDKKQYWQFSIASSTTLPSATRRLV